jgi:tetratricopeptide (TPR) repeat protein
MAPAHAALCRLADTAPAAERDTRAIERHVRAWAALQPETAEPWIYLARAARGTALASKAARAGTERDPASAEAWLILGDEGVAALQRGEGSSQLWRSVADAYDRVPQGSDNATTALSNAAAVLFDNLDDVAGATQRLMRAAFLAPDDLDVLANYAELLLAVGQFEEAADVAWRVRTAARNLQADKAYVRAAMSFTEFGAHLLMNRRREATNRLQIDLGRDLNRIVTEVQAAAKENGGKDSRWRYSGIGRAFDRPTLKPLLPPGGPRAMRQLVDYVQTNGSRGSVEGVQQVLRENASAR